MKKHAEIVTPTEKFKTTDITARENAEAHAEDAEINGAVVIAEKVITTANHTMISNADDISESMAAADNDADVGSPKKKCRLAVKFKPITWQLSAAYITKMAMLTAIAFILYAFCKFPLPFAFPSFLEIQFSELPALLAGFSMGPVSGCIVVVLKCLFKLPMTTTAYVGELTDIIIGIAFVLPASIIYRLKKDKKHAAIGLAVGAVFAIACSLLINRFVSIPFFVKLFFNGDWNILLEGVKALYPAATTDTFYAYYLSIGVLPFNILRCLIVSLLTFLLYKKLSPVLHWEGQIKHRKNAERQKIETDASENGAINLDGRLSVQFNSVSVEDTYILAAKIAERVTGGEIILLYGDLGAGKTTFTKGLAHALGVTEEITSPTFTIMNVYESGRLKLNHLDMYRLENEDELAEIGVEQEFGGNSVTVIEWNKFVRLTGRIITVKINYVSENERLFIVDDEIVN